MKILDSTEDSEEVEQNRRGAQRRREVEVETESERVCANANFVGVGNVIFETVCFFKFPDR